MLHNNRSPHFVPTAKNLQDGNVFAKNCKIRFTYPCSESQEELGFLLWVHKIGYNL